MLSLKIKLLNERLSGAYRKIEGRSGKLYLFTYEPAVRSYVFNTDKQADVDDLFNSQESCRCYFAPVVVPPPAPAKLDDKLLLELISRELLPVENLTHDDAARAQLAAFIAGKSAAIAELEAGLRAHVPSAAADPLPTVPAPTENPVTEPTAPSEVPAPAPVSGKKAKRPGQ